MDYVARLTEFANLLVNACATLAISILDGLHWTACDLFDRWSVWADVNRLPYYDYRQFSEEDFKVSFKEFLDEVLPKQEKPGFPSYSLTAHQSVGL